MPDSIDFFARRQFRLFSEIGDQARLTQDDRRRALSLTEQQWRAWCRLLADGPLPEEPVLPDMLCRLGTAAHNLSRLAEL